MQRDADAGAPADRVDGTDRGDASDGRPAVTRRGFLVAAGAALGVGLAGHAGNVDAVLGESLPRLRAGSQPAGGDELVAVLGVLSGSPGRFGRRRFDGRIRE